MDGILKLGGGAPLEAHSVGILISRGQGRHIERTASYFVLLFVRRGVLYIEEDGHEFEVREGQALLLWPERLHRGTRDFDDDLQFFWLHFSVPASEEAQTVFVPQHVEVARPDSVIELFRRFMDDMHSGHAHSLRGALYTWMILLELAETSASSIRGAGTPLAGRALAYIRTHFHEKISASHVASAMGYSPQYLGRIFQQSYRMSVAEAIRRARIDHARTLLLHTSSSASEIARQCGFQNVSYFQRVFKELEGIPPLRFRRLHAHMWVNTH